MSTGGKRASTGNANVFICSVSETTRRDGQSESQVDRQAARKKDEAVGTIARDDGMRERERERESARRERERGVCKV